MKRLKLHEIFFLAVMIGQLGLAMGGIFQTIKQSHIEKELNAIHREIATLHAKPVHKKRR